MKYHNSVSILIITTLSALHHSYGYNHPIQGSSSKKITPSTTTFVNRRNMIQKTLLASTFSFLLASSPEKSIAASTSLPGGKVVYGDETIMNQKSHGSSNAPVQESLKFGVSQSKADQISSYNRHFAEYGGYFKDTNFVSEFKKLDPSSPMTFYDSVTGKPLFVAPIGRTAEEFLAESALHGWPSFRDSEVVWDNVRVLRKSGETVSADGTHLGHNLPDRSGNRYCINLVSVAGNSA